MHCKKRNEPDGHLLLSTRLMYMQHPEAQPGSSLDFMQTCFVAPFSDAAVYSNTADRKHAVAEGKRRFTHSWRMVDVDQCSKRSSFQYSEATVSGVTFQKDLTRETHAESDSKSVGQHMGSCHDSVCGNSKRLKLGGIRSNENELDNHGARCNRIDVNKHGIHCNEIDVDKHVTFISSRVQESSSNLLPIARQGIRESAFSSISCCGQSRDGSHSNSRNASFLYHVRDSSKTSHTHLGKSEAVSGAPRSSKHDVKSPHRSSKESPHAPFLDAINSKSSPLAYVLSSGRLSLEEEARLGRRAPTIDDDFEEYFSSLIL